MSNNRVNLRVGVINMADREFQRIRQSADRAAARVRQSWERVSGSLNNADFSKVGAFSAAVGVGVGASGKYLMDLDKKFRNSQKLTLNSLHQTKEEAEALQKQVSEAYKSGLGESLDDVTDAYIRTKQIFKDLKGEDLDYAVEASLNLREIFPEIDQQELLNASNTLQKHMGMSFEESMDFITLGMQKGLNRYGDYLSTINDYTKNAKDAMLTPGDFFNTLLKGADSGVESLAQVGDAFREAMIRIKDGSAAEAITLVGEDFAEVQADIEAGGERSAKTMDRIFDKLNKIKDPKLRSQGGTSLIGTMFEDNPEVLEALGNTENAVEGLNGSTDKLNKNLANSDSRKMTSEWRSLEESLRPLGAALHELAVELVPPLAKGLTWLADKFNSTGTGGQMFILALGAIGTMLGPLLLILPSLVSAFGMLGKVFTFLSKGSKVFSAIRLAVAGAMGAISAPVAIAVAAIAGVAAIGYVVYKNWEEISSGLAFLWEGMKKLAEFAFNGLLDFWGGFGKLVAGKFESTFAFFKSLPEFFSGIVDKIIGFFTNSFDGLGEYLKKPFESVLDYVSNLFKNIGDMGFKIPDWIPVVGGKKFTLSSFIPKFHSGGVVSGTRNQERMAVLQGGERILTASQNARYEGGGFGQEIVNVIKVELQGRELERYVERTLAKNIRHAQGGR